jgi:hypothetical protein
MSPTSSRLLTIFVSSFALLALAACGGTKNTVCNVAATTSSASTCTCGQCPAQTLLIANGINGQVATYHIQVATALGAPTLTTGSPQSLGMAVLNNAFVYQSNPTIEIGSGINGWSVALPSEALTAIPGSPFSLGPLTLAGGLATSPVLPVLYVADSGKIDALQADATGALSPVAGSPFPSGTNLFLTVDPMNSYLFASDDDPPGSVSTAPAERLRRFRDHRSPRLRTSAATRSPAKLSWTKPAASFTRRSLLPARSPDLPSRNRVAP